MTRKIQNPSDVQLSTQAQLELQQLDDVLEQVREMLENETPRAPDLLEQVLNQTLNQEHDEYQRRRAYALQLLSRLSYRHMNFSQAVAYGLESLAIYEVLGDIAGLHESNYLLGIYHIRFADHVQAMDNLVKAIEFAEQIDDYKGIGSAALILSVVFRDMGQYDRSMEHLNQAMEMKTKAKDMYGQAIVFSNMARTLVLKGEKSEAIEHAQIAIDMAQQQTSEYLLVECKLTLGDVYAQSELYAEAIDQFERCLAICRKRNWLEQEISTTSKLGSAYLGIGQADDAISILEKGLKVSQEHLSTYITAQILKVLAEAYEAKDAYKQAYRVLKEQQEINQQQITLERSARLYALEQGYQIRMARQEIRLQRQRAEEFEQRAKQDRDYFSHLNQMRDEFLSAATHDLKNPLAAIRASIFLLRHKLKTGEDLASHIDSIDIQSHRMEDLIKDMLELAKLETGRALRQKYVSLNTLIREVVKAHLSIANHRHIVLDCRCHLTEEIVLGLDSSLMKRAIGNLISNAIKYSHNGGTVVINLSILPNSAEIKIQDFGIGISQQDLPHIFEHFYRVESEQTSEVEGTGLGLAIVKTIIEQHHGDIDVVSELGAGTTFTITLPMQV